MEILNEVHSFILSDKFWYYHGWVLTGLWVVAATLGIIFKRINLTILHVITFAVVDFTTIFFAGSAFYKLYPYLDGFWDFPTFKQGHIAGGNFY